MPKKVKSIYNNKVQVLNFCGYQSNRSNRLHSNLCFNRLCSEYWTCPVFLVKLTIISARGWFSSGPVCSNGPWSQPLSIHEGYGILSLNLLREGYEPVTFALQGLWVPDHAAVTVKKVNGNILRNCNWTWLTNCCFLESWTLF